MDKFKNKYRIPSARLQSWDYSANGAYFITICTKNRQHFFGEIVDMPNLGVSNNNNNLGVSTMQLNELGQLAEQYWLQIPNHFPFIELGNFVVMPNHTHGILIIDKPIVTDVVNLLQPSDVATSNVNMPNVETPNVETPNVETPNLGVSTTIGGKNEKWQLYTIGLIINQYKRIVTINACKTHAGFGWQPRFHDHVIRNAQSFENIQNYIANNPSSWDKDKFNG